MRIRIKRLNTNAVIPKQATEFAGGWDVTVTDIKNVSPDFVICKLGFAMEVPKGYRLMLIPRSSITKTRWILSNSPGLGDADYRGEYQYRFRCIPELHTENSSITYQPFPYNVGDRIGQVYIEKVIQMEFEEVEELEDTVRGSGGYGSTGNS